MNRIALIFRAEGEYKSWLDGTEADEAGWEPFEMCDLHPAGRDHFKIWSQARELTDEVRQEMIKQAVTVVDWMRNEKGWDGFCADLVLHAQGKKVFHWELC